MSNHPYEDVGKWKIEYHTPGKIGYVFEVFESFEHLCAASKFWKTVYPKDAQHIKKVQNPFWKGGIWC